MSLSVLVTTLVAPLAAESEHEVNQVLNWAVGAGTLALLLFLIGALIAFGGGREHS